MFEVIFVDVDGRCGLPLPQPGVAGMLPRSASTLLPISIDIEGRGHCKRRLGSVLSARPGPIHGCAVSSMSPVVVVLRSASTLLPISIDIEGRGHCKRRLGSVLSARPGPIHGCAVFIDVEGRCGAAIGVDALTNFDRHRRRR
ncbi:hypothetical protein [Dactylosporangium matsuzakiense]|uniref:hypothetical protein n=1 Tax=Dactylosporangium matsuzakiense TaxID=53360 RepID=UPI0021C44A97|nr:hypothetical protein [Dactylosporangium matsuzakiense]UWZ40995.1 hypothetical protein Dmats_25040 [Dactylosporangium matsuzakiense]